MYFGIRGKVALLVMLATAASALLVAKVLSNKAQAVLRDHELVDLGDESELRAWEMIDQIDGLRDDLNSIANSEIFQQSFAEGKSGEELLTIARGLGKRYWKNHLRVEVISFYEGESDSLFLSEKAKLTSSEAWLPGPEAGPRIRVSPILRTQLERFDLPGGEPVIRWAPVVWAMTHLGEKDGVSTFIRIMTELPPVNSPRHFLVLEDADGNQIIRYDEKNESPENDQIFLSLHEDQKLHESLERAREKTASPETDEPKPKVERLQRQEKINLKKPYFFQEALPKESFAAALGEEDPKELTDFSRELQHRLHGTGTVGGLSNTAGELRFLAPSHENLETLRREVTAALEGRFGDAFDGLDWRGQVECDQISVWTVRALVGQYRSPEEYLLHYAVLEDELASSIAYEMLSLQTIAIFVAAGFGFIGFLIAMHFIRPLKRMTGTAQMVTASNRETFHQHVAGLARDLDIKRQDEVGDIARASKRLFEELIAFQEELETRVSDRTRELRRANSELEKAYEKLMTLSHEKDAFVAKVSHDLRQPLNAIFLQVEALRLSDLDEEQRQDVDRIHAHAARELNLVNDILEYQKIIMGAETLNKDKIDVPLLLKDLEETFGPEAKAKDLSFIKSSTAEVPLIVADDRRVRQVLGNLIGNSIKFTREGNVTLDARLRKISEADWVEFTVSDTGRGMGPEEQDNAFVPFVSNKKDNAGGSGLGLSICKELVSQLGGRIGFVSESGKGTHFSVFLPCEPASEHYELKAPSSTDEGPVLKIPTSGDQPISRDTTILVIDDDQKVREMLTRMLETQGYRVLTAADGNLGLDMAKKHQPDAITLDVVMPGGLDGWEVLNRLKDDEATQSIPVVMVSVMAEQENGSALDVEDYLVKPIDMNRLNRVIERATGQSNSQNLLLVDDDSASLEAMSRILEEAGWKTSQASDGAEALELLEKNRPAAIILDLLMPVMDGFEFLEKLQADKQLGSIPVIVLSGKDPSEKEQEFLRERVTTVLKKDQRSADELIAVINDRIRDRLDR
ncbi:MAG: hypothetical protein CMO61_10540 [Verrucomicrobiales bacterium]|nr:hypothetical protein [Verrucomicrobiales bacterium]